MMIIARSPKKEGSGGKSLLKIGEADKVDFYRIQTVLPHLGKSYAMNYFTFASTLLVFLLQATS